MTPTASCPPDWRHDLYSCPRWLHLLAGGGRGPDLEVVTPTARLPVHTTSPTGNPRYAPAHLLRGLGPHPGPVWFAGPMSGYRTDPQRRAPDDGGAALDGALRTAAELAARSGSRAVVPFLPAAAVPTPAAGGRLLFEETEYWLRPAPSLADYLAPLPSYRRTAVRRELKAFFERGARLAVVPLAEQVEEFAALTVADSARRGEAADLAGMTAFLGRIAASWGKDALLIAAFLRDRLAGAALGVRHDRVLWLRMTGFGPELEGSFAYFVLTYYAATLLRDELDVADVHLGVGGHEAKRRRGARPAPLFTWISAPGAPAGWGAEAARPGAPAHWPTGWGPATADQDGALCLR